MDSRDSLCRKWESKCARLNETCSSCHLSLALRDVSSLQHSISSGFFGTTCQHQKNKGSTPMVTQWLFLDTLASVSALGSAVSTSGLGVARKALGKNKDTHTRTTVKSLSQFCTLICFMSAGTLACLVQKRAAVVVVALAVECNQKQPNSSASPGLQPFQVCTNAEHRQLLFCACAEKLLTPAHFSRDALWLKQHVFTTVPLRSCDTV